MKMKGKRDETVPTHGNITDLEGSPRGKDHYSGTGAQVEVFMKKGGKTIQSAHDG